MQITTAEDGILKKIFTFFFFFFFFFKLDMILHCEFSARQIIHMKHHALFSSKDKSKKKIYTGSSAAILLGT